MAKVYIAGPMRGYPNFNFPAFDAARDLGLRLGWDVVSPADLDRNSGFNEMEGVEITPALVRQFVERDIGSLLSFRVEDGDAIALLPGWRNSVGAKAELAVAQWLGLRVVDAQTFVPLSTELVGYEVWSGPKGGCLTGLCGVSDETAGTVAVADAIANDPTWK